MRPLIIAFSMYSKIPMPHFEWKEEDMRYAMCFFPLVGLAVGLIFWLAGQVLFWLEAGPFFRGAVLAAIPVIVTGGIHVDGFLDTCDARASYGDRKRKLEILKDSHVGAFAVISGVVYFLLLAGAYSELTKTCLLLYSPLFVVSRSLSGLAVALFPNAREHGMLADFTAGAQKKAIAASMVGYLVLAAALMLDVNWRLAFLPLLGAVLTFLYYWRFSNREFGGITGDLAGYFLQLCELVTALALVFGQYLIR